ncbi:hypothetical protein [Rhodoblastus acidophilus]|uniref:hypothetical protein n=1 Tax=Rhodoblastus acidophilus TaxID=1074 RepID=UPI000CECB3ED|nr:hypothetical protein [Rhodoblastus acidophilus]RAI16390.1 hypothetical protein CH337_21660 [Rhodoblastus acidophilus]
MDTIAGGGDQCHAKTGLDLKSAGAGVAMAFPSGALGACLVQFVDAKALDAPIPIIVGGIALYFALPLLWNPSFGSCPLAADAPVAARPRREFCDAQGLRR